MEIIQVGGSLDGTGLKPQHNPLAYAMKHNLSPHFSLLLNHGANPNLGPNVSSTRCI